MTIVGHLQLNNLTDLREHPLIRLRVVPDENDLIFSLNYEKLFSLTYDNNTSTPKLILGYSESKDVYKNKEIEVTLLENE